MLNDVIFRDAGLNDLPAIVGTYNATVPGRLVTADLEPVSLDSKKEWFYKHNPATRPLYIIEVDKQYAGWLSYTSFYGRPAYDKTTELSIYLESSMQGKGLGAYCLQFAMDKAPSLNIHTLLGFIFGHNEPSLKLFYKKGFEKWAHLPEIADMEGTLRDLVIVGKKV
jgi:L-amino acid N-acyltransferase YncA